MEVNFYIEKNFNFIVVYVIEIEVSNILEWDIYVFGNIGCW